MSDETRAERKEAAATRRRWITLAEVLAVAGVLIAALTLWSNWADRREDAAARTATETSAAREKARLDLVGTVADGGRTLALKDARHDLREAEIAFPTATGVGSKRPAGDPEIDADWFDDVLLKLTDGGPDTRTGRLPVLVTVRYWDGDIDRAASGIYDVIWRTEGRVLRGRTLRIEGLKLRQRGGSTKLLDAAWARAKP